MRRPQLTGRVGNGCVVNSMVSTQTLPEPVTVTSILRTEVLNTWLSEGGMLLLQLEEVKRVPTSFPPTAASKNRI